MASLEEIRNNRLAKLQKLKEAGINPYPAEARQDYTIAETLESFEKISKKKKATHLVGRVMGKRGQGAVIFFDFNDGTGAFQGLVKKDETGEELSTLFAETVDIGDFIEISGSFFLTKQNQKTILVKKWRMLAKSLRPLPEKWHGLQDVEERYRRRYLDTLMNGEIKERFLMRSKVIKEIRAILDANDFLEVETQILQQHAGGATAKPFVTHHNALDLDMYLRIAPELFLKRLLVGGFPKVYEIGRNFRNEGIDVTHNPEFTMLEYYEAYSSADEQMAFVEKMLKRLVKKVLGKDSFEFDGNTIDFSKPFKKVAYGDLLKQYAHIPNILEVTFEDIVLKARQLGIEPKGGDSKENILDAIYKKTVRPKLIQPTFITGYFTNYLPLAKEREEEKGIVDAFQLLVGGLELVKAFSELNDPIDQAARFKKQEEQRNSGDEEAQTTDTEFLEALEYGMPPAGGVGIGIDRLVMLFGNIHNIREVILFPTLRPKGQK